MLGIVNKALVDLIRKQHGDETWQEVRRAAGVDDDIFLSGERYPDHVTYSLVSAASAVLDASPEALLESFGEHWIRFTAEEGYGALLGAIGDNLSGFLANLESFHTRVVMMLPNVEPPGFEATDIRPGAMRLHYRTSRPGLAPFVVGILRGLGIRFGERIEARLVESRELGADHDVFEVTWSDGAEPPLPGDRRDRRG